MRSRKSLKIPLLLGILSGLLTAAACSKNSNFINPGLVPSGVSYYPVSNNPLVDTATGSLINHAIFFPGDTLTFEVDYYSQDSLQGLYFYAVSPGNVTLVKSFPYDVSYFSTLKLLDTAVLQYVIPDSLKPGTEIQLNIQIKNTNSLQLTRTVGFQVQ
jgi:hypothetical protein